MSKTDAISWRSTRSRQNGQTGTAPQSKLYEKTHHKGSRQRINTQAVPSSSQSLTTTTLLRNPWNNTPHNTDPNAPVGVSITPLQQWTQYDVNIAAHPTTHLPHHNHHEQQQHVQQMCAWQMNRQRNTNNTSPDTTMTVAQVAVLNGVSEQDGCNDSQNQLSSPKKSLTVMTWNLMRDFPHFLSPNPAFAWQNREPRIIKIIKDADPDILTLQECIDLPKEPILRFLNKLKPLGYVFEIFTDVQGNNNKQLKVVTCWKQNSIYRHSSRTLWLSPQPFDSRPASMWNQKVARPIGVSCFMHSFSERPLWVWNTHLGHSEAEKKLSCELLVQLMSEICTGRHASVLMGDFNIFARSDYYNLRRILTSNNKYRLNDLGANAITVLGNYSSPNTFVSSSIDREQLPRGSVGDRLDHIFGKFVSLDGPMLVWNKTMLEEEPPFLQYMDVFPSDHLPLVAHLFC